MSKIDELKQLGFSINWNLINIGYHGEFFLSPQITKEEIIEYAYNTLNYVSNNVEIELIVDLIQSKSDEYLFSSALKKLSEKEYVDTEIQYRKWRLLFVKKHLDKLPIDYTEGLIELTELWVSLGMPDDSPHIFQGINNSYTIKDYYSQCLYDEIKKKHKDWVMAEKTYIIDSELH